VFCSLLIARYLWLSLACLLVRSLFLLARYCSLVALSFPCCHSLSLACSLSFAGLRLLPCLRSLLVFVLSFVCSLPCRSLARRLLSLFVSCLCSPSLPTVFGRRFWSPSLAYYLWSLSLLAVCAYSFCLIDVLHSVVLACRYYNVLPSPTSPLASSSFLMLSSVVR